MTKGAWHKDEKGTRYYYGPSYYTARNPGYMKLQEIDGKIYNFDNDGYLTYSIQVLRDSTSFKKYAFDFGTDGVLAKCFTDQGIVSDAAGDMYYVNKDGYIPMNAGLVQSGQDYYFVVYSGKIVTNGTKYINATNSNGFSVSYGWHSFDADGKLTLPFTGVKAGADGELYYYVKDVIMTRKPGLVEVDGAIYDVKWSGKVAVNEHRYITPDKANGLIEVEGSYVTRYFGADGKLVTE